MDTIKSTEQYDEHYNKALKSQDDYWAKVGENFEWYKKWESVSSGDFNELNTTWYEGAELNITVNCIDRHLEKNSNKTAIIWEPNDPSEETLHISYQDLHDRVCQFANVLKNQGITKGDVVCFYMSMVPELMVGVLACARIGAVHSVIFGGFSSTALGGRINDCKAKVLVTNDEAYRGNKIIPLKQIADDALENSPCVETVLVLERTGGDVKMKGGRDKWLNELLPRVEKTCEPTKVKAEDPLFILYTSGSTGSPKGLLHTTAGYMAWTSETFKNVFQMEEDDIFWCTADIGWVTGHSYMAYGPTLNGATQVVFEGVPTWPNPDRFWEVVDKHQVTHFYTAPTAIRALEACGIEWVKKHKLDSLKVLGSVGEPINEEAWDWYNKNIGKERCPIVDTWWQTETGGIMISSLAGVTPSIPAHATLPLPGVEPILVDADGKIVEGNPAEGNLCMNRSWPGIARSIYGDHHRYRDTYFTTYPGKYFTGDGAKRDENGNYRITGRVDDVINVSGHRIGTAEVEDAINEHPEIVESAVVGYPHHIKGQGIYAYVILQINDEIDHDLLHKEINEKIIDMIGPIAKADVVQVVKGLPKTRSGKIMRRILRKVANGQAHELGDTSTLLNPEVVEDIILGSNKIPVD